MTMIAALCIVLLASPSEEFDAIQREWVSAVGTAVAAMRAAEKEKPAVFARKKPDIAPYARRFLALAEAHPDDSAARDALLWIVMHEAPRSAMSRPQTLGIDPSSELLVRATDLLIEHHANDLQVGRTALFQSDLASGNRERLFTRLYERASERAAKGTAALALGLYLPHKAKWATSLRRRSEVHLTFMTEEYERELRASDPDTIRAEAERLLERVITEYGDVPYARARGGDTTVWDNGTISRTLTESDLARHMTLAQVAETMLDEMHNLGVGSPAPEIEGMTLDDKPLKLSDFRGKVVVLSFWGTWCGPCMAQVPHERELVERLKDRPFALLGVDCDPDKNEARKVVERERMMWPNWFDGPPGEGPIAGRYHIKGYPSIFVLDAKGIIRGKYGRLDNLELLIGPLLKEVGQPRPSVP
jgi:thiol-disulfide isomerase/thioredoxin